MLRLPNFCETQQVPQHSGTTFTRTNSESPWPGRIAEIRAATAKVIAKVESLLPKEFPSSVAGSILEGMLASTKKLAAA
jgi:hypothetical protein